MMCSAFYTADAQRVHTLSIREGKVYVDGDELSSDRLPVSLDVDDVNIYYSFSGDIQPLFELNGIHYVLDGEEIYEANRGLGSGVVSVQFRGESTLAGGKVFVRPETWLQAPASSLRMKFGEQERTFYLPAEQVAPSVPEVRFVEIHAQELRRHADEFLALSDKLSERVDEEDALVLNQWAQSIQSKADEAAWIAEELPQLEAWTYLNTIQSQDQELYERLLSERAMEVETVRLAHQINSVQEGPQRDRLIDDLHNMLGSIFELKQENRREEIRQLENQLETLQERLEERERLRKRLIDRRLQELIGSQHRVRR